MTNFAVKMARSILELEEENHDLRRRLMELEGIEQKYDELLSQSLKHNERMALGLLHFATSRRDLEKK